jgi:hypothetical protein
LIKGDDTILYTICPQLDKRNSILLAFREKERSTVTEILKQYKKTLVKSCSLSGEKILTSWHMQKDVNPFVVTVFHGKSNK